MGKGKLKMSSNNGGIGGSGVYGLFGTTIHCDSEDDSLYCSLMKFMNVLVLFIILGYVIWIVYVVFGPTIHKGLFKKRRK